MASIVRSWIAVQLDYALDQSSISISVQKMKGTSYVTIEVCFSDYQINVMYSFTDWL